MWVDRSDLFDEEAVSRHRVIDARRGHDVRGEASHSAEDHYPCEDLTARLAEESDARLRRKCPRRSLARRDILKRHEVKKRRARQNVNNRDDEDADDKSARQSPAGIARLARDLRQV